MKEIANKYFEGKATETEMRDLLAWLRLKENYKLFNNYKLDWLKDSENNSLATESREIWYQIQEKLTHRNLNKTIHLQKLNRFLKIAAIFLFVVSLSLSGYFYHHKANKTNNYFTSVIADKGQICKTELPDGSIVWLNSGSVIKYGNGYAINNRQITLSGEAYFQAAKNKKLPMLINCGELQVKVAGTSFNVMAYPETGFIDVVLEEGSVNLLNKKAKDWNYLLKPGERAKYTLASHDLKISKVNTTKFTSWKDGILNIYNQTLEDVLAKLEMRYNQKFEYHISLKNIRYTFSIKNETLEEIILLMGKITPVKAEQKNNTITFNPDKRKMRKTGG